MYVLLKSYKDFDYFISFHQIPEEAIRYSIMYMELFTFKQNEIIYKEGDQSNYLYIIIQGSCTIREKIIKPNGETAIIDNAILREGSIFGEMGLINNEVFNYSIVTKENNTTLLGLSKFFFHQYYHRFIYLTENKRKVQIQTLIPCFKLLSYKKFIYYYKMFLFVKMYRGDYVYRENEIANNVYLILNGRCLLMKGDLNLIYSTKNDLVGLEAIDYIDPSNANKDNKDKEGNNGNNNNAIKVGNITQPKYYCSLQVIDDCFLICFKMNCLGALLPKFKACLEKMKKEKIEFIDNFIKKISNQKIKFDFNYHEKSIQQKINFGIAEIKENKFKYKTSRSNSNSDIFHINIKNDLDNYHSNKIITQNNKNQIISSEFKKSFNKQEILLTEENKKNLINKQIVFKKKYLNLNKEKYKSTSINCIARKDSKERRDNLSIKLRGGRMNNCTTLPNLNINPYINKTDSKIFLTNNNNKSTNTNLIDSKNYYYSPIKKKSKQVLKTQVDFFAPQLTEPVTDKSKSKINFNSNSLHKGRNNNLLTLNNEYNKTEVYNSNFNIYDSGKNHHRKIILLSNNIINNEKYNSTFNINNNVSSFNYSGNSNSTNKNEVIKLKNISIKTDGIDIMKSIKNNLLPSNSNISAGKNRLAISNSPTKKDKRGDGNKNKKLFFNTGSFVLPLMSCLNNNN